MPKNSLIGPRKYISNLRQNPQMAFTLAAIAAFGGEFLVETEAIACRHFALLDGLSTVSVDSLHSTLKVVMRSLDTNHKKAAFKDNEN